MCKFEILIFFSLNCDLQETWPDSVFEGLQIALFPWPIVFVATSLWNWSRKKLIQKPIQDEHLIKAKMPRGVCHEEDHFKNVAMYTIPFVKIHIGLSQENIQCQL